jgi:hypothetical protein
VSPKYPDEIVRMYVISAELSEGRQWITVCVLSAEGTDCDSPPSLNSALMTHIRTISSGYFGLTEDGAAAAPKHVGTKLIF